MVVPAMKVRGFNFTEVTKFWKQAAITLKLRPHHVSKLTPTAYSESDLNPLAGVGKSFGWELKARTAAAESPRKCMYHKTLYLEVQWLR